MQISKKERKYRNKIIAENHIKKNGQVYLDSYIKTKSFTYKEVYLNCDLLSNILTQYSFDTLGKFITNFGATCVQVTKALDSLTTTLTQIKR